MKIAVIGVGSMGQNHARVYSEIAELAAVCDANSAQAKKVAHRFGAKAFDDPKELLKDASIEAIAIASPTKTHFEVGIEAIAAGKHVLVEKPICSTVEEAQRLIDAAKAQGVTLAVGHIERHNPVVQVTKELISKKQIGEVITMASRRVSSNPVRIQDTGVIMDMGSHDIDVMRFFAGAEAETVFAVSSQKEREDWANVQVQFKNGIGAMIEVNWLTPMKVRRASLTCSKKFVELDYISQTLQMSSSTMMEHSADNLYQIPQEYDIQMISLRKAEPLKNEAKDFIEAIEKKKKPMVTGEDGREAIRIAYAAIQSGKSRKPVSL